MKKTFFITFTGLMFIAGFSFIITSCRKEQNSDFNSNQKEDPTQTTLANASAVTGCNVIIPDSLKVPAGNKLVLQTYAKGVQIYQLKRSTTNPDALVWVNIAPSATLYAKPDFTNQLGTHYAGPSWQFTKGPFKDQKVVGVKMKASTQDPTAVPWLLLKAVDSLSSAGNKITYIQRLCTTGGLAPAPPVAADEEGRTDSIPYTAAYLFYTRY